MRRSNRYYSNKHRGKSHKRFCLNDEETKAKKVGNHVSKMSRKSVLLEVESEIEDHLWPVGNFSGRGGKNVCLYSYRAQILVENEQNHRKNVFAITNHAGEDS